MSVYVNLSLSGTGHMGTELDPLSRDEFTTLFSTNTYSIDDYYLRGSLDNSSVSLTSDDIPVACNFYAWDLELYGPWRLNINYFSIGNATVVKDGILKNNDSHNRVGNYYNCYLIGIFKPYSAYFYGCTAEDALDSGVIDYSQSPSFQDCTLHIVNSITASYPVLMTNCAIDSSSGTIGASGFTFISCQTDWVAPSMPAWDAEQSAFDTSILFADVDAPPQPGNPPYTNYETDLWGNARTGIGTGSMASAAVAPEWTATYPKTNSVGGSTAQIGVEIDQDGTGYFVAILAESSAPSSVQVKAGQDSTGSSVATGFSGSVSLTANVAGILSASNLTPESSYNIYVVAESTILQEEPVRLDITTIDTIAPVWISTYPKVRNVHFSVANFLVETDSNGAAYFVVVPSGAAAPSSAQVKAGQDGSSVAVATGYSGNVALVANVEDGFSAMNLVPNTYDVYFVAEDSLENLQSTPVGIEFVSEKVLPINSNKPGKTFNGVTIAGPGNVDSRLPKISSFFRSISMPDMKKKDNSK